MGNRPSKGCKGYVEERDRCIAEIHDPIERTVHQCRRYRVVGDYCEMHARLQAKAAATDAARKERT